ncbi:MAG: UDP-4-amino-4,6-dideoxy-N-acetyl-beta-L-altrosamine transaminase [Campylobacterales bacterium]
MLPYSTQSINDDDIAAVVAGLKDDYLTQGAAVGAFEEALARYIRVGYAVVVNSATSALHIAYLAAGIGLGDEVITTPISFVATANAALMVGAKPVFVDVRPDGLIDEKLIEAAITPRTKAIVPVSYAGMAVAQEAIDAIAKRHGLMVIEDASHSLGGSIEGKKIGSWAKMSIFSFHPVKPITTFEGGAVVTDDEALAEKLRLLRSHGIHRGEDWEMDMVMLGCNYRLSDVACRLGLSQLSRLDSFIAKRHEIASIYDAAFADSADLRTIPLPKGCYSSRHLYPILLEPQHRDRKREIFRRLREQGIGVQVHYRPIYQNSYYKEHLPTPPLPGAESFYSAELSLPCHQKMTKEDAYRVVSTLLGVIRG